MEGEGTVTNEALESTRKGMSQLTKDRFDVASKSIAIVGGIVSAVVLIVTLQGGLAQRTREHRWNQAKLAMEFVDTMLSDHQAFDAMRMIDWGQRKYEIGSGRTELITSQDVRSALDIRNNAGLSPSGVYVRESFDRLFHYLGKMERSLNSGLVTFDDVRSPLAYYVPILTKTYGEVLTPYMKQLGHDDAIDFLQRLSPPPAASRPRGRRDPTGGARDEQPTNSLERAGSTPAAQPAR
jgi:hypothetical protein